MVQLRNCSIQGLFDITCNRKVYIFGASLRLKKYNINRAPDYDIFELAYKIVDNDSAKWNTEYYKNNRAVQIISPKELCEGICENDIILIVSNYYGEILEQLDSYKELNGIETYIIQLIDDFNDSKVDMDEFVGAQNREYLIPPKIHYFWFGSKEIPDKYKRYMESWEKLCPDYEIILWNESNYDVTKHPYMKWAYDNKKWAFVPDYARLDVIYNYGGIYLDTDVELIKSLDELRRFPAYIGYETTQMVNTGSGFGAKKGNDIIRAMRDEYDRVCTDGEFNMIASPAYQTKTLRRYGLKCDNSFQILSDKQMVVLPTEFLCGLRMNTNDAQITDNTFSLHHFYTGDWGGKDIVEKNRNQRDTYAKNILDRISLENKEN